VTALPREVDDPRGRLIRLEPRAWAHIIDGHLDMAPHLEAILAVLAEPDHQDRDERTGRERYWGRGLGPSRWLVVVVEFEDEVGRVVTAYASRKDPPWLRK
jgi:hypothetical protein